MIFLALGDIVSSFLLVREYLDMIIYNIPVALVVFFALFLIVKAFLRVRDVRSWFDLSFAFVLILTIFLSLPIYILIAFSIPMALQGIAGLFLKA